MTNTFPRKNWFGKWSGAWRSDAPNWVPSRWFFRPSATFPITRIVPLEKRVSPHLYYYLEQANKMPPPAVEPQLAPSPATRTPILGRLWQRIRGEMHNLILFYVNKSVRDQNRVNASLISTLNELTRVIQDQQAEIDALRDEVRRLEK
jgi:hypothetical protein